MCQGLWFAACHVEAGGAEEINSGSRGIQGAHSLATRDKQFSDAFKGLLQEAGCSVVPAFALYY